MSTAKMRMRLSSSRRHGSGRARRTTNASPAAIGVSVLLHAAGIGALLSLRPVPYPLTTLETIEIALVTAPAHAHAGANDGSSGAIKGDGLAGVAPAALSPAMPVTALPPQWALGASATLAAGLSVGTGTKHALGLPTLREPQSPQTSVTDALGDAAACPAVSGSTRTTARHAPCVSAQPDDPLGYAPTMTRFPVDAAQPGKVGRENDDWTFTQSPSVLGQSILLPDTAPPGNRALRKWVVGLFR
jgi:hypothetical protein